MSTTVGGVELVKLCNVLVKPSEVFSTLRFSQTRTVHRKDPLAAVLIWATMLSCSDPDLEWKDGQ